MIRLKIFEGSPLKIEADFNEWSEENANVAIQSVQYVEGLLIVFHVVLTEEMLAAASRQQDPRPRNPSPIVVPKMQLVPR